jgi:hypothetical protein
MWQVVSGTANLVSDCDVQAVARTVAASQGQRLGLRRGDGLPDGFAEVARAAGEDGG